MYLNNHTYYSLRYGTMSPEELVLQAKAKGITKLALTDINNSTAMPEFVKLCNDHGVEAVAGMEFRDGDKLLFIVIAKNPEGYFQINKFLSHHNLNKTPLPQRFPQTENTFVIYPHTNAPDILNENEFIGIRHKDLTMLHLSSLKEQKEKLVMLQTSSLASPTDFEVHRHLRAVDHNIIISRLQQNQTALPSDILLSPDVLRKNFEHFPYLISNSEKLLDCCHMEFDFKSVKNKKIFTSSHYDDKQLLEKLTMDGFEYRYDKSNKEALRRIHHELDIIDKLGFSSYFLITWDIIRYSMSRGFYHVGRGSGANSIVAYCLRITNVDPIELDLYFERFINPKRTSPPDFDIDFSWKDRDHVHDYIFKRYGREHTALLGTISTFRDRSTIRELSKVMGLPKAEIDNLVLQMESRKEPDKIYSHILKMAERIADFPNLRSIHAGGVLISEKPINYYSAFDLPPKNLPTVQWDMYTSEDLGFEKIDILSQRGIGHINDCVKIVKENHNISLDVHKINELKNDPKVKELLISGETLGCFYIESPAMRGLLKKLKCDNYISLTAASSIIRPGVARSGMMREYIVRFNNPDSFEYLHPVMENILKETYGIMVYQEDVLKVCSHFAGLDLADADILRRAMSGKHRSKKEMQRIIQKFFDNCKEKGYPDEITKEVWRQIESFAGYSFSKAHSASFAVESYQSMYLKAYYPLEFMTAVVNNFGGFYQTFDYLNEAKRLGATIELPCVNNSNYTSCIKEKSIYIGFIHIANLETKIAKLIDKERNKNGNYASLEDFVERTNISLEQMIILIRINAFRFTGIHKARLMWKAHILAGKTVTQTASLFKLPVKNFSLPEPEFCPVQEAYDEMELLGFPVTQSHFDLVKTSFRGDISVKDLMKNIGKNVKLTGFLVTIKYVRTIKKELMHFGCFMDHEGNLFDTVHFPATSKQYPFRGQGVYLLAGKVNEEFGVPHIVVEKMARLATFNAQ
ncbi:MAG: DNA polymerase III subunit alpha [Bacteroidetes bacterium]|nr:DNA polymerase III subunit alpha [Bacteroidota bacterium]